MFLFRNKLPFYPFLTKYLYHLPIALLSLILFQFPSKKLIIIGVTGTKGKTTTALSIYTLLKSNGIRAGISSTALFAYGGNEQQNAIRQTMPGRFFIQKILRDSVNVKDEVFVLETTSEGINQFRNLGINYDILVFTNLSPEHLVTHKTFKNYRNTKAKLFSSLKKTSKNINGKKIEKSVFINKDDKHSEFFAKSVPKGINIIFFGLGGASDKKIDIIRNDEKVINFLLEKEEYMLKSLGEFMVFNVVPAILIAKQYFGINYIDIKNSLQDLEFAGRFEFIKSNKDFKIILDYAHEPLSIKTVTKSARTFVKTSGNLILIAGAVGGGRWKYNAKEIGEVSVASSDYTIFTEVDNYSDDIKDIFAEISLGIKTKNDSCFSFIKDRKKAIKMAIKKASKGDVVLITGKGSELAMNKGSGMIEWNEKEIIKDILDSN